MQGLAQMWRTNSADLLIYAFRPQMEPYFLLGAVLLNSAYEAERHCRNEGREHRSRNIPKEAHGRILL